MYCSLWVPGSREEPFFPLCPSRSSWTRCPQAGGGLPATRVAAYAPSDITRTRSQHCESLWRIYYCGNCLIAPFADRLRAERRYRNPLHQCRSAVRHVAQCAKAPCATRHGRVSPRRGNARHRCPRVPVARQYYYSLRTDSRRHSVGLTFVLQHEGKAASAVHHRWLLPAACELPHSGGVRKYLSRPTLGQVLVSYSFRIRLTFGVTNWFMFYDPVVLGEETVRIVA